MNLLDLFVKVSLDDQASEKVSSLSSKLGSGLQTAATVGAAAVGAAAAGIAALTTAAVNNYAEYEQLVGGVETLFETSSDTVLGYAENAYKTAGLSANEYMETVTSFSASLLQSLGGDTAAAAEYADLAITDMADNANKMGTDISMIQSAYSGFAKQNYTMLDNLKLGYGGTKEEMERLLQDADSLSDSFNLLTDENGDLVYSFDDIVEAINIVQTDMGITGTTAREAGTTIQGSVASMQSAWSNLLTGLADGSADVGELVNNLVETVVGDGTESNLGVLGNVLPAVETALNGASELVGAALPVIMELIPGIINDNLPLLAEAAVDIVQSLVDGISENQEMLFDTAVDTILFLVESFVDLLPEIVALGVELLVSLATGIVESIPTLIPTIVNVVLQIVTTLTNPTTLSSLISAALVLIYALASGLIAAIPELLAAIPTIIDNLVQTISKNGPSILATGVALIGQLAVGLIKAIPTLILAIPQIILSLVNGFATRLSSIINVGKTLVDSVKSGFQSKVSEAYTWGKDLIQNFISGVTAKWEALKTTVSNVAQSVKNFLGFSEPEEGPLSNFHTYAPDMMELFMKGIEDNKGKLLDTIADTFNFGENLLAAGVSYGSYGTSSRSGSGGVFGEMLALMEQYLPAISAQMERDVVLDDGTIVGKLTPQIDAQLGQIYKRKNR